MTTVSDKVPLPRGARRKQETRLRLLKAALELMSERGVGGVTIHQITEAADVGFGSFYNHFASQEAIYEALIDEVFDAFGSALDRIAEQVEDPAEVLSASVRYTIRRAQAEPVWGRFLVQTGFSPGTGSRGLAGRMTRDLKRGVATGRFRVQDPELSFIAVGSTALGAISYGLARSARDKAAGAPRLSKRARNTLPERTVALVLRILGLPAREATAISQRPLPAVELPASRL